MAYKHSEPRIVIVIKKVIFMGAEGANLLACIPQLNDRVRFKLLLQQLRLAGSTDSSHRGSSPLMRYKALEFLCENIKRRQISQFASAIKQT